ncbi:hypothetical protein XBO1_2390005 [Xenorhabdus bovienii str. oregonense]|uniref:Uncharacterized protein n=1 Tax=Xenorhabdus bovienii str. oregonense TaxID=1398202 RepID=A0A077NX06_XENBV|nr:hypothetical protein XBO1_2390005 [Xenorhabdus bovienii str. oregonense]
MGQAGCFIDKGFLIMRFFKLLPIVLALTAEGCTTKPADDTANIVDVRVSVPRWTLAM